MGSLAQLAVEKGYRVTGCDANVYPPMSTQLEQAGIELIEGYGVEQLDMEPDCFVIGNAMSRGNPLVEAILQKGLRYTSGPQWLRDHILQDKWVLAVSGTHGKTTTSSMLAWILEYANMSPGYLIGGVPSNFSVSARLGDTPFFVIEADEYDSAFFDKRSKFVHYQPRTLIINNLEFDHADIFDSLADIQKQFHHLVRTVPNEGLIIRPDDSLAIDEVIEKGCWTPVEKFTLGDDCESDWSDRGWKVVLNQTEGAYFSVCCQGEEPVMVEWPLQGQHNVSNAVAAMAAARHVGVTPDISAQALSQFEGVKRRMECIYSDADVNVYDDFAHHPTAIETTLQGLRARVGDEKILVLIEPRSNTMRMGVHQHALSNAFQYADRVLWYVPDHLQWNVDTIIEQSSVSSESVAEIDTLVQQAKDYVSQSSDAPVHIVVMSNGGFEGVHLLLVDQFK